MKLYSCERFTGRGAAHWTGLWIPQERQFVRLSEFPDEFRCYEGRSYGFERYSVEIGEEILRLHACIYYRSNGGVEKVFVERADMLTSLLPPLPTGDHCAADWLIAYCAEQLHAPSVYDSLASTERTIARVLDAVAELSP